MHTFSYLPAVVGATLLMLGAATCSQLPIDQSASAASSNDPTIIFQGDGVTSQKGYLFIQKREGTPLTDKISLITPALNCKEAACARYQFFRKDGTPGSAAGIPKAQTTTLLNLSDLIGHTGSVTAADDGEYSGIIQMFYVDATGHEFSTVVNGFVRLNVLGAGYSPVGCGDPSLAWSVNTAPSPTPCKASYTTSGRSVTCGVGCSE